MCLTRVSGMGSEPLIYIDGRFVPKSEARVSVYDHGFLYGDGVFEGIRAYNGVVFKLREHIERLYDSARAIMLEIPMSKEEMIRAVIETLKRNNLKNSYIRLIVTRGVGDLGLDPRKCPKPSVIIIAEHLEPILGKRGVSLIFSSVRRDRVDATSHQIKSMNYLNSILAKLEAIRAGADDAILLDERGFVSEASAANLFMVNGETISTPPISTGILPGITRATVMELARKLGYGVQERDITPVELMLADEVFLTGTGAEIVPVAEIAGRRLKKEAPGPVTTKIIEEFEKLKGDPSYGIPVE